MDVRILIEAARKRQGVTTRRRGGAGLRSHARVCGQGGVAGHAEGRAFGSAGTLTMRQQLLALGVMVVQGNTYSFTQDYTFSSPSTAASVVLGRSANGRAEWKDAPGFSLKALQADA